MSDDPGEVLAHIGDIEVTASTLRTPAGEVPLSRARVTVTDGRFARTPTWAVFCAIVGFFVVPVISLLFLLVRETVAADPAWVRVDAGDVRHETPVVDPAEVDLALRLATPPIP